MKKLTLAAALVGATLGVSGCVQTSTSPTLASGTTPEARACLRAVSQATGTANVEVFSHVPYSRGAYTNVLVPSQNARYMCHTDANGDVFEVLEI
jgi:hypothetical protein